jgi:hypothetical protein
MQALLIFLLFFCVALLFLHLPFSSLFLSKVLQNQNTIQTNQQISYQPNTFSAKYSTADLTMYTFLNVKTDNRNVVDLSLLFDFSIWDALFG